MWSPRERRRTGEWVPKYGEDMPWDSYASPALQAKLTTGEAMMARIKDTKSSKELGVVTYIKM